MTFAFDAGAQGSEGPWIAWSARGTQDDVIPAKHFYLRDQDGKHVLDAFQQTGVVLDIHNMKTGWCFSTGMAGQAPKWVWGETPSVLPVKPGDDYKKGLHIRCAIGGGETATWEDSGAGAWMGFADLAAELSAGATDPNSLPLVQHTGTRMETFGKGSTAIPVLTIVKWVPRPDCLKADVARHGIDTGKAEQPAQQPAQQAALAAASVPADAQF